MLELILSSPHAQALIAIVIWLLAGRLRSALERFLMGPGLLVPVESFVSAQRESIRSALWLAKRGALQRSDTTMAFLRFPGRAITTNTSRWGTDKAFRSFWMPRLVRG